MMDERPADLRTGSQGVRGRDQRLDRPRAGSRPRRCRASSSRSALPLDRLEALDTARIGIFLARTVPSGDGDELRNRRGRRRPEGVRQLLPVRTPGQLPTDARAPRAVSRAARPHRKPTSAGLPAIRRVPRQAGPRERRDTSHGDPARDAAARLPRRRARRGLRASSPARAARSCGRSQERGRQRLPLQRAAARLRDPRALRRVRAALAQAPDIRGVSAAGVPLVGIGHNGDVAWGFTSGLSDEDDLYVEQVTGDETYRFRGEDLAMECRDEDFTYRTPPTDLPDAPRPDRGPGPSMRHPPARRPSGSAAPSTARSRTPATASPTRAATRSGTASSRPSSGSTSSTAPRTIEDVDAAHGRGDLERERDGGRRRGHIGYWHPGLHPSSRSAGTSGCRSPAPARPNGEACSAATTARK